VTVYGHDARSAGTVIRTLLRAVAASAPGDARVNTPAEAERARETRLLG
jgi:hypothetical protein